MKTFLLLSAASLALAGPAAFARSEGAPSPPSAPADSPSLAPLHFGRWGVDLSARDTSVRPGDDFDRYANGTLFLPTLVPKITLLNSLHLCPSLIPSSSLLIFFLF